MTLAGQPRPSDDQVQSWYTNKIKEAFKDGKLYGEDVDFYCFQEFYPDGPEKQPLVEILKQAGFSILGDGDLGIAYKTHQFALEKSALTSSDNRGALYALLKHKQSGETICVATDHVQGFDARLQKTLTRAFKSKAELNPVTQQPWKDDDRKIGPGAGDQAVSNSLKVLSQELSPSLLIYGLDANSTAGYLKNRVHPKRMQQFFDNEWVCDQNDQDPTLIDHFLEPEFMQKDKVPSYKRLELFHPKPEVAVKYDYVCAKAPWRHEITITSKALGPNPQEFSKIFSDHRPVLATIQIKSTWSSRLWTVYKFFRLFPLFSLISKFFSFAWLRRKNLIINLEAFDNHFKDHPEYLYLKTNSPYLGLLVAAEVTPQELSANFQGLKKSLSQLLQDKNLNTRYQDTPAQICEFFIVSCVLKKLGIKHPYFTTFATHPNNLIGQLKEKVQELAKKKSPTSQDAKIQQYLQDHMQNASLMRKISQQ